MKIDGDTVTFETTGNEFYANNGIIGLCEPENGKWEVSEGYDGCFSAWSGSGGMTKEEKIELSDYMIDLWSRFKKDA